MEATTKEHFYTWIMESKKRTKKIKDTQKQKEISKVAEEDNSETMEVQAENSLVGFLTFFVCSNISYFRG